MSGLALLKGELERGLALLGLVDSHPATDENLRGDMPTVLALLPAGMVQADIDAGMAHGHTLDLDAVVADWLATHGK